MSTSLRAGHHEDTRRSARGRAVGRVQPLEIAADHEPTHDDAKTAAPVRVAILDDCPLVVAGLRATLQPYSSRVQVTDFDPSVPGAVDIVLQDPQVLTGQLSLCEQAGLATACAARLVAFSWDVRPAAVRHAFDCGAAGFLSKAMSPAQLVQALECIMSGRRVVVDAQGTITTMADLDLRRREYGLTDREAEMLTLIAQGLSNAEIAAHSYLSINSVKTYVRTAYRKIGVSSRSQAVAWALHHDLDLDQLPLEDVVPLTAAEVRRRSGA